MATNGHSVEEKPITTTHPAPDSPVDEKADVIHEETAHEAAERGKPATDK
jgi:MFS transporter, ACS family, DAL5 transporter family protein